MQIVRHFISLLKNFFCPVAKTLSLPEQIHAYGIVVTLKGCAWLSRFADDIHDIPAIASEIRP